MKLKVSQIVGRETPNGLPERMIEFVVPATPPTRRSGPGFEMMPPEITTIISTMGGMMMRGQATKLVMYLNDREYHDLGMVFEVNTTYEVTLQDGNLKFERAKPEV